MVSSPMLVRKSVIFTVRARIHPFFPKSKNKPVELEELGNSMSRVETEP